MVLERHIENLKDIEPNSSIEVTWKPIEDATWFQRAQVEASFRGAAIPSQVEGRREIPWYTMGTACFAIRRDTFNALGGFYENMISGEDCEFRYRLYRQGGKVYRAPNYWVTHSPPETFAAAFRKTVWYEHGNAQLMCKHPTSGYRVFLKNRWHVAGYLALRTVALLPLIFIRASYHYRRPALTFRPVATLLSYVGAWAYCITWNK